MACVYGYLFLYIFSVKNNTINIFVYVQKFLWSVYLEMHLSVCIVRLSSNILGNGELLFKVVVPVYPPSRSEQELLLCPIFANLIMLCNFSQPGGYEMISLCGFNLYFPD
jgi:hypothetical protein